MTYVTSDLHGFPFKDFMQMLSAAGFGKDDELWVLGDVIDRNGDGGVEMLRWMAKQPNVHFIRGNHEDMLLKCESLFEVVVPDDVSRGRSEFSCWMWNGGKRTFENLRNLLAQDAGEFRAVMDFIKKAPIYKEVTAGGRRYFLSHAGIGNFAPGKPLENYSDEDFIWFRPNLDTVYDWDRKIICGHTPVELLGDEFSGRALRTETWIDIDTGAAYGEMPTILRLEDEQEFSCPANSACA